MEAFNVVVRFTAQVTEMVRGAEEAARAVDHISDSQDEAARSATTTGVAQGQLSFAFDGVASSADRAADQVDDYVHSLEKAKLMRGGLGQFGGPPGKGIVTDVGSAFRGAANLVQGFIGALTLVMPTINIIIAGLVGIISLLGAGVIAAAAFAAALAATGAAMAFTAFKWRDLLVQTQKGAETWQGALAAIEAQAFSMSKRVVASFTEASAAGKDLWTSVGEAGVKFLKMMEPVITAIVDRVKSFVDALNGVKGASSPFLDFLRTWIQEWKVLLSIVNQDIPAGKGLLGFFEKYEAPAKAFVEGIAQVINGIRKMSAMGLGLNMDQLAELIRNVFTALAALVQIIPKFTNSLVAVGLQLSKFLVAMLPVISAAVDMGSAILSGIVAPLVNGLLVALEKVMSVPIIGWLTALAGGFVLVAVAIAKLSFGAIPFTAVLEKMALGFAYGSNAIGQWIASLLKAQIATGEFASVAIGASVIIGALAVAFLVLKPAIEEVGAAAKATAKAFDESFAQLQAGAISTTDVLNRTYTEAIKQYQDLSFAGKFIDTVQNIGNVLSGGTPATRAMADAVDALKTSYDDAATAARQDIMAGSLSDESVQNLKVLKSQYEAVQGAIAGGSFAPPAAGQDMKTYLEGISGEWDAMAQGAADWLDTRVALDNAFRDGIINAGQYVTMLQDMGEASDAAGNKVDLYALKVKAGSNTIAQALDEVQKNSEMATGALEGFALSSGQAFESLRTEAIDALTDKMGGLLGTGEKVTEFFQKQAGVIEQWKDDTAGAFNFVSTALSGLADGTAVSFEKIRSTLQGAVTDAKEYAQNWTNLVKMGASQELLRQVKDLGQGGSKVLAGLVQGGREGVHQVNALVRQGVDLSTALADNMADALGVTMERLTAAVEVMVSKILGVHVKDVERMVDNAVDNMNKSTGKLKSRTIKINFDTNALKAQRTAAARAGAAGSGQTGIFPAPDTNAIRAQYTAAGKAAGAGMSAGIRASSAQAEAAATQMGDDAVLHTKKAIGAASPAKAFIGIGMAAVQGLAVGMSKNINTVVSAAASLGAALVQGVQQGISNATPSLMAQVDTLAKAIEARLRKAFEARSPSKMTMRIGEDLAEGLRLGFTGGIGRLGTDVQSGLDGLMLSRGRRGRESGPSGRQFLRGELHLSRDSRAYVEGIVEDILDDGRIVDRALGRAASRRHG